MEEIIQKHLRSIRIIVALALFIALFSVGFSYILFKEVSMPLELLSTQRVDEIEKKVNYLISSRLNGRMDIQLQSSLVNMQEIRENSSGEVKAQAEKAMAETKELLKQLRGKTVKNESQQQVAEESKPEAAAERKDH